MLPALRPRSGGQGSAGAHRVADDDSNHHEPQAFGGFSET